MMIRTDENIITGNNIISWNDVKDMEAIDLRCEK
jgi:hypothetical protein